MWCQALQIELSCYSYSFSLIRYNVNILNNAAQPNSRLKDIVDQYEQCRAYEYFVYFGSILNDLSWLSQDNVLCAVVKIFMLSFSFYGDAQLSNILRICVFDEEQENSYSVFSEFNGKESTFTEDDMKRLINAFKKVKANLLRLLIMKIIKSVRSFGYWQ